MLNLTTTTEIRPFTGDLFRAQLVIHLSVAGERVHSYVLASGPRDGIEDLAAGKCTLVELQARWDKQAERPATK